MGLVSDTSAIHSSSSDAGAGGRQLPTEVSMFRLFLKRERAAYLMILLRAAVYSNKST